MKISSLFDISLSAGILFGILFLFYANFYVKIKNTKSIVYLNWFVVFLTLHNLQIVYFGNRIDVNILERKLLLPWYALIIPFFYTFLLHHLQIQNKVFNYLKLCIGIFVLQIVVRLVLIPNHFHDIQNLNIAKYAQIEEIFNAGFTFFLFGKIGYLLLKQKHLYVYVATFDKLVWLKYFLIIGFVILVSWVIAIVYNINNALNPNLNIYYPLRFSAAFALYWITYQGFFQTNLLVERIDIRENFKFQFPKINKNENVSKIQIKSVDKDFEFINNFIQSEKSYLNPYLNIEEFSKDTKIPVKKLSQILKNNAILNFTDFINQIRIERAKTILLDTNYEDYTIVGVCLECGFNSKSTFYRVFQRFTKTTPTKYIQDNQPK
ncbi:MAG: AraC family transcriptional regulator [Flavobacterium sp.]|nr:AraC family transcriptional regulator [Flavobacterium sp.]